MKQQNRHNDLSAVDAQSRRIFAGGKFEWSKSHDTVWSELDSFVIQHPAKKIKYDFRIIQWAAAAIFILFIGITGFMRFYSQTIATQSGNHFALILPDRSSINLNAQSYLTYHPYWWQFERKLTFEGEGFFEVKKGNQFTVESRLGTTQVLGTSFNVYSRDEIYRVTCITGTVKVISKTNNELIIRPNCKATVHPDGKINFIQNIETLPEISWKDNTFFFTSVPIRQVFSEIERQYGITINTRINNFTLYTGNFSRNQKVEEILGYICPALGYKYIHQSEKVYYIIPDEK